MEIVTNDLSKFGYRELAEAGELLKEYADKPADFLSDGLTINFNPNSGYVFLSDEDYNVGVMTAEGIVQFFSCPQCGYEGTNEEAEAEGKSFIKYSGYCSSECEEENK